MAHFPHGSLLTTVPDSGGVSLLKRVKMKDDVDLLIKSQEKNTFKIQKIIKIFLQNVDELWLLKKAKFKDHLFCHVNA